ncbi:MAG: hypothetical protein J5U19_11850 [Candidatus Methanoperedens sp.]|nr:hypothetical protein [Candidatus Methanoperedens sp.]
MKEFTFLGKNTIYLPHTFGWGIPVTAKIGVYHARIGILNPKRRTITLLLKRISTGRQP